MKIDASNYEQGNKAMASVLLLYYHLARGGGFSGDETVYIDRDKFDGFSFLEAKVVDGYEVEIDEKLIREGAVVYLLCDLNDMVSEFDDSFMSQATTKNILQAFNERKLVAIAETKELFELFKTNESQFKFNSYDATMREIIVKYVEGRFNELAKSV